MAIIQYVIGVILLFCLYSIITASPLEYGNRGKFNCPDRTSCSCSYVLSDYEIECPPLDPKVIIIIKVQPTPYIQIECMAMDENIYTQLPVMNMSDITMVQFRRCPLPGSGSSIQTILDRLGMTRIRTLKFLSNGAALGSTLVRQHLSRLTELERLLLSGNGLSDLPEDLFNDVGNLTWLDLKSNKVHLPVNIFQNLKKLEYLELGYNNLKSLEHGVFRNQQKLKYLNLWGNNLQHLTKEAFEGVSAILELDLSSNNIEFLQADVFSLLKNLTNINLSANKFKSLPKDLFLTNTNLSRIRLTNNQVQLETLPSGLLSNMSSLLEIYITCDLISVPDDLFSGSINIRNISMAQNKLTTLPPKLFDSQNSVVDIDLSNNQLNELDDELFVSTQALIVLRLSHNSLANISGLIFQRLYKLQELYLDNNNLHIINFKAFDTAHVLQNIQLQNNHLTFSNMDQDNVTDNAESLFQNLKELHILNLRNNSIRHILRDWNYNNYNLKELDLSHNNITFLTDTDVQFLSQEITVNLSHNAIEEIDFDELETITNAQDEIQPSKNVKIYLDNNPLRCDCLILHFIQFLRQEIASAAAYLQIIPGDLKCAAPEHMVGKLASTEVNPKELTCVLDSSISYIQKCPDNCSCLVRRADKALIVNCSNANLTTVPDLPNPDMLGLKFTELFIENNSVTTLPFVNQQPAYNYVVEIHAKNNKIHHLLPENIPRSLTVLELTNNNLQWMNSSVFEGINKTRSLQQLWLSENPWLCDCSARDFLVYAQVNYKNMPDLKEIKCNDGRQFIELGVEDLCPKDEAILIAVSVVIALLGLLIGILAALYYKYQQEVKVWMYAHNLCLWFVTEEELDKNKKYDAFISYSHKDVDFVTEYIVPVLENGSHPFKLCLHDRDWVAGEFIQESIARSVEDSRRTIIVLSPNFLESIWGKMEFQVAHKNAITEGRAKVIVVIYGDIGASENIDPALKLYLKTNTYIKWGDPWFWKKLRYAMPHPDGYKSKGLTKTPMKSSIDDILELIKPVPSTPPLTTPPAELAGQKFQNGLNGHVNGAFIINTNAKQSDV